MRANYVGVIEYDRAGNAARLHALALYDGEPWLTTVCGLAGQAYPPTGEDWAAAPAARRCARCVDALAADQPRRVPA